MASDRRRTFAMTAGNRERLGAHYVRDGVNFAVFSENATKIEVCLYSESATHEIQRLALPERTGSVWHGHIGGLRPGALYGLRAYGAYAPEMGHRFNPNKLLLDPYTTEFAGSWREHPAIYGYDATSADTDLSFDDRDSAAYVPKSIVSAPSGDCNDNHPPRHAREDLFIYEAHVKGLTNLHPDIPQPLRGTYEGLASDPVLDHLNGLGVTAIELMPVHAFLDDGVLQRRGLHNYWGYNSIGFFAPEPRYFGAAGIDGFRTMVRRFHEAGIEVVLDVVYNHTAEGDQRGPTLSFKGLDNASYYRLIAGQPRYYVNDTGCGNTLNVSHPFVLRMVMDSLRFWVEEMHVDGFRFDLATTLARENHGFEPNGGFLDALRQDPVLARAKLIAEPWDIGPGGYRVGEFPPEFAEWNDGFRDAARRFWRGDAHGAQELAGRLLGSAGDFDRGHRRAWSSVNFLAAHDGFTLADVVSYNDRHNHANGEGNRDGHHANLSDNCGHEGPTDDEDVLRRRTRRVRNLLATLFLSQGTPMLLAGDEIGNSQGGNNNAYCQDNRTSWIDWTAADTDLLEFVRRFSRFRRDHRALRQSRFLHGAPRRDGKPDVEWRNFDGDELNWRDPGLSSICLLVRGADDNDTGDGDTVFMVFNGEFEDVAVTLPEAPAGNGWRRELDTADDRADAREADDGRQTITARSVVVFTVAGATAPP